MCIYSGYRKSGLGRSHNVEHRSSNVVNVARVAGVGILSLSS